jgi:hypothetical protein
MDYGLSLIERDIAAHPDHLVLTADRNLFVHFALGIKPTQRRSVQCFDSREMRTRKNVLENGATEQ